MLILERDLNGASMSTQTIYQRLKNDDAKWRYVGVEEGRGKKTGGATGPFYIRRNAQWYRLSADVFSQAQTERDAIVDGKVVVADGRVTLKTAIEKFLELKKRKNPSTISKYTFILNEFLAKTRAKYVDEFTDKEDGQRIFDSFVTSLEKDGAAPKTIENKVNAVVFMLKEAGIDRPSRMAKDLLPTIEEEVAEPYSQGDLKKIFAVIDDKRDYTAFMFFLVTACREQEVAFAQWNDLKVIGGKPHFRVQAKPEAGFTPKNHLMRDIQINPELVELLKAHRETVNGSEWLFPNENGEPGQRFLRKFKKICFRAGLNCGKCHTTRMEGRYERHEVEKCCATYNEGCEKHYLHRLRKTRATFWHEHGVSLRTIQHWLGHSDLSTTQKYLGVQDPKETEHVVAKPMF